MLDEKNLPAGISVAKFRAIKRDAASGAVKVCARSKCFSRFDCGHANREDQGLSPIGALKECPLAKYKLEPEPCALGQVKRLSAHTFDEYNVTDAEVFGMCAMCEHSNVIVNGNALEIAQHSWENCLDCPVNMAWEAKLENEAEARWS